MEGLGKACIEFAEGSVTRTRREFKLAVSEQSADALCSRLEEVLQTLPERTDITSIYFDRPGLLLARRAQQTPDDCLKVRTKEYFPDRLGHPVNSAVFEIKREKNGVTKKRRSWVARAELADVICGTRLAPLAGVGALIPVMAVTYAREVYQRFDGWRVTVDRDIRYHAVSAEVALGRAPVTRAALGDGARRESRVVVEVKHAGGSLPEWLETLRALGATRYSKFAEGMGRIAEQRRMGVAG